MVGLLAWGSQLTIPGHETPPVIGFAVSSIAGAYPMECAYIAVIRHSRSLF